jgi:ABC-2 type transport system ATP-binding protein
MSLPIIQVNGLTRAFVSYQKQAKADGRRRWFAPKMRKTLVAVGDLSFSIEAGEKVAFIGPNGAGKSTTLKMLCGLLCPTSGSAEVCGLVPWEKTQALAQHIGLVFGQKSQLWPALPVRDSFDLLAKIYAIERAAYAAQLKKLTDVFRLHDLLDQPARTLSLGQRTRCDIAASLLHQPSVLFLDEPTIGLDVTAKASLRDHLNKLAREFETTILLTSHDTDDIEEICQRVILIDHGLKLLDTTLLELKRDYTRFKTLRLTTLEETPAFEHVGVKTLRTDAHVLDLAIDTQDVALEHIVAECLSTFKIQDIAVEAMELEEIIKKLYEAGRGRP